MWRCVCPSAGLAGREVRDFGEGENGARPLPPTPKLLSTCPPFHLFRLPLCILVRPCSCLLLAPAGSEGRSGGVRKGRSSCVLSPPFRAARPPHQQPSSEQRTIRADYFPYPLSFCLSPHTPSLGSHRTSGRRQPSPFPRSALSFKSGQPPLARIATLLKADAPFYSFERRSLPNRPSLKVHQQRESHLTFIPTISFFLEDGRTSCGGRATKDRAQQEAQEG